MQAQPPGPAWVTGSVVIGGPPCQIAVLDRGTRAAALDGRRGHNPNVVVPQIGLGRQQANQRLAGLLPCAGVCCVRTVGELGELEARRCNRTWRNNLVSEVKLNSA